ncbi:MAG: hypothetical protein R6W71_04380, partial [Bacteroidales bacterium]
DDPDLESYRLLYRDSYEFAVGHSCAASWGDGAAGQCGWLQTDIIPDYELLMTTPSAMPGLEMEALANAASPADMQLRLQELPICRKRAIPDIFSPPPESINQMSRPKKS